VTRQALATAETAGWNLPDGSEGALADPEVADALSNYAAAAQDACLPADG
jgi:hypothetical protein